MLAAPVSADPPTERTAAATLRPPFFDFDSDTVRFTANLTRTTGRLRGPKNSAGTVLRTGGLTTASEPPESYHPVITDGIAGADVQFASQRRYFAAAAPAEFRVALQQLLRQRQQLTPAHVQPQAPAFPLKYRRPQLPLHLGQRHAGGGLTQMQALRRGPHAAVLRNLHKDVELARADAYHQTIL